MKESGIDWSAFYRTTSMPDLKRMITHPDRWQVSLAEFIRRIVLNGKLLEAGCGYGQTSLLVGENARRTLMDIEGTALEIAEKLFSEAKQEATFKIGDIFQMPFQDDCFDVVFNAGVLEHFDFCDRRKALLEMVRVVKPSGIVCVAVPNHYSVPYRFSYEYRKARGTWPFPDEEMIYDFTLELAEAKNVVHVSRETVDVHSIFHFLPKPYKVWFKLRNMIKSYEGYLSIIKMQKRSIVLRDSGAGGDVR